MKEQEAGETGEGKRMERGERRGREVGVNGRARGKGKAGGTPKHLPAWSRFNMQRGLPGTRGRVAGKSGSPPCRWPVLSFPSSVVYLLRLPPTSIPPPTSQHQLLHVRPPTDPPILTSHFLLRPVLLPVTPPPPPFSLSLPSSFLSPMHRQESFRITRRSLLV